MGEKWLHDRANGFKQQQCRSYRQLLLGANLYSRQPDVLQRSYCCEGRTPVHDLVGAHVLLEPCEGGVRVLHGNAEIGRVTGEEARTIAQAIADEPHCPEMALGIIDDASQLTTEFHVRVVDHSKEDE